MAKETKAGAPSYGEVVQKLEDVVKRLESGELSLEDSLKAFESGIGLVRKGEQLLADAEARIEQLLVEDGAERAVPLELKDAAPAEARPAKVGKSKAADDDDVPF